MTIRDAFQNVTSAHRWFTKASPPDGRAYHVSGGIVFLSPLMTSCGVAISATDGAAARNQRREHNNETK